MFYIKIACVGIAAFCWGAVFGNLLAAYIKRVKSEIRELKFQAMARRKHLFVSPDVYFFSAWFLLHCSIVLIPVVPWLLATYWLEPFSKFSSTIADNMFIYSSIVPFVLDALIFFLWQTFGEPYSVIDPGLLLVSIPTKDFVDT